MAKISINWCRFSYAVLPQKGSSGSDPCEHTLTGLMRCSPIHSKQQCTVCSDPFLSFSTILALLWDQTEWASLHSHANEPPWPCHWLSLLALLLVLTTAHCVAGTPHKICCFGDALTQSYRIHNLAQVKNHSDPCRCPLFLLPTHHLQQLTFHLLPNISHPLTGVIVTR